MKPDNNMKRKSPVWTAYNELMSALGAITLLNAFKNSIELKKFILDLLTVWDKVVHPIAHKIFGWLPPLWMSIQHWLNIRIPIPFPTWGYDYLIVGIVVTSASIRGIVDAHSYFSERNTMISRVKKSVWLATRSIPQSEATSEGGKVKTAARIEEELKNDFPHVALMQTIQDVVWGRPVKEIGDKAALIATNLLFYPLWPGAFASTALYISNLGRDYPQVLFLDFIRTSARFLIYFCTILAINFILFFCTLIGALPQFSRQYCSKNGSPNIRGVR